MSLIDQVLRKLRQINDLLEYYKKFWPDVTVRQMKNKFVDTPSGQWISTRHIVILDILETGKEEQLRHTVQATLVTGDKQALRVFQGANSKDEAERYIQTSLENFLAQ